MMHTAHSLVKGDRFIPADKVSEYGNDEHLIFLRWDHGEAIGSLNTAPSLGYFILPIHTDTDVLLARPVHHEQPTYSI